MVADEEEKHRLSLFHLVVVMVFAAHAVAQVVELVRSIDLFHSGHFDMALQGKHQSL